VHTGVSGRGRCGDLAAQSLQCLPQLLDLGRRCRWQNWRRSCRNWWACGGDPGELLKLRPDLVVKPLRRALSTLDARQYLRDLLLVPNGVGSAFI